MIIVNRMKLFCFAALLSLSIVASAADHVAPPAAKATDYACHETHDAEHLTIAADVFGTHQKAAFFRVDYPQAGFLPIRIIVSNDGDKPVNLSEARIYFVPAGGERVKAAVPPDVSRRIDRLRDARKGIFSRNHLYDKEIQADFDNFEYGALVVEPHTTRAGFLFYDIDGLDAPLTNAKLYLRSLKNSDGAELFYFEVPLDKCGPVIASAR
jgi:hypothetical protein